MARMSLLNSPLLLGFEHIERALDRAGKSDGDSYPPYNIERLPDNAPGKGNGHGQTDGASARLRITLAVAGFTRDQLEITVEDRQLTIRGEQNDDEGRTYLHRGIAARRFQRTFILADGIIVEGAHLRNGLLSIELVRPQPEPTRRTIEIQQVD